MIHQIGRRSLKPMNGPPMSAEGPPNWRRAPRTVVGPSQVDGLTGAHSNRHRAPLAIVEHKNVERVTQIELKEGHSNWQKVPQTGGSDSNSGPLKLAESPLKPTRGPSYWRRTSSNWRRALKPVECYLIPTLGPSNWRRVASSWWSARRK